METLYISTGEDASAIVGHAALRDQSDRVKIGW